MTTNTQIMTINIGIILKPVAVQFKVAFQVFALELAPSYASTEPRIVNVARGIPISATIKAHPTANAIHWIFPPDCMSDESLFFLNTYEEHVLSPLITMHHIHHKAS